MSSLFQAVIMKRTVVHCIRIGRVLSSLSGRAFGLGWCGLWSRGCMLSEASGSYGNFAQSSQLHTVVKILDPVSGKISCLDTLFLDWYKKNC